MESALVGGKELWPTTKILIIPNWYNYRLLGFGTGLLPQEEPGLDSTAITILLEKSYKILRENNKFYSPRRAPLVEVNQRQNPTI